MQQRSIQYASPEDVQVQILDADLLLWPVRLTRGRLIDTYPCPFVQLSGAKQTSRDL